MQTVSSAHEKRGLRQAIAGIEAMKIEPGGLQAPGKALQRGSPDPFRATIGQTPTCQVQRINICRIDAAITQREGRIGSARDRTAILRHDLQPSKRTRSKHGR